MQGRTRPIIVRFVSREDGNFVWAKPSKIKQSTVYSDAYITEDFARAIQEERKVLIKSMIKARDELGMDNVNDVGRYLITDSQKYDYNTIPVYLIFFLLTGIVKWKAFALLKPNVHIETEGKCITLATLYAPIEDKPSFFQDFFDHLSDFQCDDVTKGGESVYATDTLKIENKNLKKRRRNRTSDKCTAGIDRIQ